MLPLARGRVGVIPWSPLAPGGLRAMDEGSARVETDEIGRSFTIATAEADRLVAEKVAKLRAGVECRARRCACVATAQAGSHGADYWLLSRHLDDAVRHCRSIEQRRDWDARRTLRSAPDSVVSRLKTHEADAVPLVDQFARSGVLGSLFQPGLGRCLKMVDGGGVEPAVFNRLR